MAHFVCSSRTDAVQVSFVAEFYFLAVQLHGTDLDVHGQVAELGFVVHLQLFQLITSHLFFVQKLVVSRLGALQVEFQNRSSYIYTVASLAVSLDDTAVDGRVDDFFEGRHDLARCTDTDFYCPLVHGGEVDVPAFYTALHEGNEHRHADDDSGTDAAILHDFLVAFLSANVFWYFSIHIFDCLFSYIITFLPTKTVPEC